MKVCNSRSKVGKQLAGGLNETTTVPTTVIAQFNRKAMKHSKSGMIGWLVLSMNLLYYYYTTHNDLASCTSGLIYCIIPQTRSRQPGGAYNRQGADNLPRVCST